MIWRNKKAFFFFALSWQLSLKLLRFCAVVFIPTWVYRAIAMVGKSWIQRMFYQPTEGNPPYDPKLAAVAQNSLNTMPPWMQWWEDRRKEQCIPDAWWTLGALSVCRVSYSSQCILGIPMWSHPLLRLHAGALRGFRVTWSHTGAEHRTWASGFLAQSPCTLHSKPPLLFRHWTSQSSCLQTRVVWLSISQGNGREQVYNKLPSPGNRTSI